MSDVIERPERVPEPSDDSSMILHLRVGWKHLVVILIAVVPFMLVLASMVLN